MATIRAVLKREQRKTDGTHLVLLRLTVDRKAVYIGTAIYLPRKHWNDAGTLEKANWVSKSNPMHREYNGSIKDEWQKLDRLQLDNPELTAAQLKTKRRETGHDLLDFFKQELDQLRHSVGVNTFRAYESALRRLEEFCGPSLPVLDLAFLKRFEADMLQGKQERKAHSRTTASRYLSVLKTFTRKAVQAGIIPFHENPFHHFRLKAGQVHKDQLSGAEIALLLAARYTGRRETSRRVFLVQFFLSGMRVGDVVQLRWEQIREGRLEYRSQKTKTRHSVKIPEQALTLLGESKSAGYVFDFLEEGQSAEARRRRIASASTTINRELKAMARALGIRKHISSHVARHSFASQAWTKTRDIKAVSQALGHTTIGMTENYLRSLTYAEQDALSDATFEEFV